MDTILRVPEGHGNLLSGIEEEELVSLEDVIHELGNKHDDEIPGFSGYVITLCF